MSPQLPSLTIFFPCYNDEHTIGRMVLEASALASTLTSDFEILVIDDGSSDRSLEQLEKVSREGVKVCTVITKITSGHTQVHYFVNFVTCQQGDFERKIHF